MRCSIRCVPAPVAEQLDRFDRAHHVLTRRHVVRRRIQRKARNLLPHASCQWIEQLVRIDLVVVKIHPDRQLGVFCRENIDRVAAHAERTALEFHIATLVLHLRKAHDDVALAQPVVVP